MQKIDKTDKKLLEILQENSKTNIKTLEKELKITKTPIYERIKNHEKSGLVKKYVAVLDREKIPDCIVVFCSVSLESQKLEEIEKFHKAILQIPEVIECYLMIGSNDFLLKVVVKDLKAYHQFSAGTIAALPNIGVIQSTVVLKEMKYSTVFPII